MAPYIHKFSAGQDEYFEMLSSLIEDFDRKKVSWLNVSGSTLSNICWTKIKCPQPTSPASSAAAAISAR